MIRTLNAEQCNKIANNPQIRPLLGGIHEIDLTDIVASPFNFCFMTDDYNAAHILVNKGAGIYEVHTLSLPEARGRQMHKLMQDARAFMFLQTDAVELQTFVPENQLQTLLWANLAGFRESFKRKHCFDNNGTMIGGSYLSITYQDWVLKDKQNLKFGQAFHSQIEQFELLTHDEDPVHDAWAGSVCRSQNLTKAVTYYNQWASRTGYALLQIVSFAPYVIDIANAVLQLNADKSISVLKVNSECLREPQRLHLPPQV